MSIDSNVSQAIKNSGKISMTKNLVFPDKTVETTQPLSLRTATGKTPQIFVLSMFILNSSHVTLV